MSLIEQEISDRIHASVQAFIVLSSAVIITGAQVEDVRKALQIGVRVLTIVLAPHGLTVNPAGPHLNDAERVEVDSDGEDFHAFPASTVGLLVG